MTKNTPHVQKTILSLCALAGMIFTNNALAQSISLSLTQPACNNNGILTATFSAFTYPLSVSWTVDGNTTIHNNVTTATDVFTGYSGGHIVVVAMVSNGVAADAVFSAPPFTYTFVTTPAARPAFGVRLPLR